jgi:hypothetical protein
MAITRTVFIMAITRTVFKMAITELFETIPQSFMALKPYP